MTENVRRLAKRALHRLFRNRVYTIRRGAARGLRRKGGFAWVPRFVRRGTQEHRFLEGLALKGLTAYDVGAFEGAVTLFLSRAVGDGGRVVAFEPNPVNAARLRENLALNGLENVEVREVGLANAVGRSTLAFTPNEAGRGTMTHTDDRRTSVEVSLETLDRLVAEGLAPPAFVKIDVEGFEAEVVEGARETLREHAPRLLIEMHGRSPDDRQAKLERLLAVLLPLGYGVRHVETGETVTTANAVAFHGHLVCEPGRAPAPPP